MLAACEPVNLAFGQVIDEPGDVAKHVYFPTGCAISSLLPMEGGHVVQVALTGSEGVHGVHGARGARSRGAPSIVRSVVHIAGTAWRLDKPVFRRRLATRSALSTVVDRYMEAVVAQLVQAAGCHRFHRLEQRVARWLLMTADRAHAPTFALTHEMLAHTLGVRRVGVTNAAGALQRRKLIRYRRGTIQILDRKRLLAAACSCYGRIRKLEDA
jgi:CRP-like cAMP-binding protein